jgi:hypothetical protein
MIDNAGILDLNKSIQDNIFDFRVGAMPAQVTSFFETVIADGILSRLEPVEFQRFQQLLKACLQALLHKDYLYLADLLQYEVLPLLAKATQ